jgi:cellulose biosynthesis protein BcsQ
MESIVLVGGGKGGVGKSTVTLGVLDCLRASGRRIIAIETDDSNPDVYKTTKQDSEILSAVCNLDDESGYARLEDIIKDKDGTVVIDSAARATESLARNYALLQAIAEGTQRRLITLWVLNRQRDSLELLRDYLERARPKEPVYGVLNTFYGSREKFGLYDSSQTKGKLSGTILYPKLSDPIADKLMVSRIPLWAADKVLRIIECSLLFRYRKAIEKAFLGVLS